MEEKKHLPVEMLEEIEQNGEIYADKYLNGVVNTREHAHLTEAWASGATAYVAKLHQANETIKELERQNEKMKSMATGWRPLLEEVLKLDDLDVAFISKDLIEKIKTFLYGE